MNVRSQSERAVAVRGAQLVRARLVGRRRDRVERILAAEADRAFEVAGPFRVGARDPRDFGLVQRAAAAEQPRAQAEERPFHVLRGVRRVLQHAVAAVAEIDVKVVRKRQRALERVFQLGEVHAVGLSEVGTLRIGLHERSRHARVVEKVAVYRKRHEVGVLLDADARSGEVRIAVGRRRVVPAQTCVQVLGEDRVLDAPVGVRDLAEERRNDGVAAVRRRKAGAAGDVRNRLEVIDALIELERVAAEPIRSRADVRRPRSREPAGVRVIDLADRVGRLEQELAKRFRLCRRRRGRRGLGRWRRRRRHRGLRGG